MMALASMRPSARDFDPKLYQYGGLWIYPVGALIKVFAKPQADAAYYLDRPEEFGRFYVIARLYVVAWAMIGAWAVFWIVRRTTNQPLLAACATLCYALMPVIVNMAHEAKPHLPAAVLILLAVIAATRFVESGLKRYWFLAGVLVGASAGMVLSAIPAIVILPIMCWLRHESWNQRVIILITSIVIAIDVYFITNPYVLIHLLGDRTILLSNLRNSQAMYTGACIDRRSDQRDQTDLRRRWGACGGNPWNAGGHKAYTAETPLRRRSDHPDPVHPARDEQAR